MTSSSEPRLWAICSTTKRTAPRNHSLKCAAAGRGCCSIAAIETRSVEVEGDMASRGKQPAGIAVEPREADLDRMRGEGEEDVDVCRRERDAAEAAEKECDRIVDRQPLAEKRQRVGERDAVGLAIERSLGELAEDRPQRIVLELRRERAAEVGEELPAIELGVVVVEVEVEKEEKAGKVGCGRGGEEL